MRSWLLIGILILSMQLPMVAQSQIVPLTSSGGSCATTHVVGTNSDRQWTAYIDPGTPNINCDPTAVVNIASGASVTLRCDEATSGVVPPLAATAITISLVINNNNFGSATPGGIRTISVGTTCSPQQTFTVACTANGSAGGTAIYGIIRLHIRAQRTTVPTYDVHSEDGQVPSEHGIFRCTTTVAGLTENGGQSIYVAGDSIGININLGSASLDTVTATGNGWVTCGTNPYNVGTLSPDTSTVSATVTIVGPTNVWQDDCTNIGYGFVVTRLSTVTGFTSEPWTLLTSGPGGVSISGQLNASITSTDTLDRTISCSGPTEYHLNASGTVITAFERLEGVTSHCHAGYVNARGTNIGNNVPMRGWRLIGSLWRDTTNFPSADFLSGGGGTTSFTSTSLITAASGTYKTQVETYSSTARTDAVLLGLGNTTNTFTLTNVRTFSGLILHTTRDRPNTSTFISGNDQMFVTSENLSNVRGELLSGVAVVCHRVFPNGAPEADTPVGLTNASGDTANKEFPVTPPTGRYHMICNSDAAGNSAVYDVVFFIVSPFTADVSMLIAWKVRPNGTLTLTAGINTVSPGEGSHLEDPDDTNDFRYDVVSRACDGCPTYLVSSGFLIEDGNTNLFRFNITLPSNLTNDSYVIALAYTNFTGRLFLASTQVHTHYTVFGADGMLNLSTSLDAYLPFIFWGGLMVWFFWIGAAVPAIFTLLVLAGNLFTPPMLSTRAGVLIVTTFLLLHIVMTKPQMFNIFRWGKKE